MQGQIFLLPDSLFQRHLFLHSIPSKLSCFKCYPRIAAPFCILFPAWFVSFDDILKFANIISICSDPNDQILPHWSQQSISQAIRTNRRISVCGLFYIKRNWIVVFSRYFQSWIFWQCLMLLVAKNKLACKVCWNLGEIWLPCSSLGILFQHLLLCH